MTIKSNFKQTALKAIDKENLALIFMTITPRRHIFCATLRHRKQHLIMCFMYKPLAPTEIKTQILNPENLFWTT